VSALSKAVIYRLGLGRAEIPIAVIDEHQESVLKMPALCQEGSFDLSGIHSNGGVGDRPLSPTSRRMGYTRFDRPSPTSFRSSLNYDHLDCSYRGVNAPF
jgi:hypothetical protein